MGKPYSRLTLSPGQILLEDDAYSIAELFQEWFFSRIWCLLKEWNLLKCEAYLLSTLKKETVAGTNCREQNLPIFPTVSARDIFSSTRDS